MTFEIQVRDKETGEWKMTAGGDAKSRRSFMRKNGQSKRVVNEFGFRYWSSPTDVVGELVTSKKQWRCVAV